MRKSEMISSFSDLISLANKGHKSIPPGNWCATLNIKSTQTNTYNHEQGKQ